MSKFAITVMTVLCIGLTTLVAQGSLVHYTFNETSSGNWDVLLQVTPVSGDTMGLSGYSIWVNAASGVTYTQNRLSTYNDDEDPIGFIKSTLVKGYVGAKYNAGNFQTVGYPIYGIGKEEVYVMPPESFPPLPVDLDVPALLGTLTTPAGLHLLTDLYVVSVGLFDADGIDSDGAGPDNGYQLSPPTPTWEVNPIPEPATLALLAIGSVLWLLGKRRSA